MTAAIATTPPVLAHPPEWPEYDDAAVARATELIRAGRTFDYRHGPEISEIEELFSARHHGRYAVALNSGTSALLAAYYALGVGPGDEVLVPALGFLATASPLLLLGATPVLCDAGDETGTVTAETLRARISPRTRAIAVTHLFGHPCPMDEITALARQHGLALVEDCSHAHGSTYRGQPVGTFGDLAVFSVGGLKLVSGGMGGILLAREGRHHDLACLLSAFQHRSRLTVRDERLRQLADVGLGGNLRMSPVAAVLASSHANRLDALVSAKHRNISRLRSWFDRWPGVCAPPIRPGRTMGGWYDAVISVDTSTAGFSRDQVIEALVAEGVKARVPTTGPLHLTSVFSGAVAVPRRSGPGAGPFRYQPSDLPRSVALHDRWVSLPATYFNDPAGRLVEPYLAAFERAWPRLDGAPRASDGEHHARS
jgi:dTDP-4-amino-4,6-dideoxygalactose transaminase